MGAIRNRRATSHRERKKKHFLDVTMRSSAAARQRNARILAFLCTILLIAGVAGGAWYGVREGMRRFFWENADYVLTEIEIKTDGPLTREQITVATGIREGVNIFTIDLAKAREALVMMPQVEHAEVERMQPNKIVIEIAERKPVAWIAAKYDEDPTLHAKSFLVDRRGVLMKARNQLPEYFHLPVIYGVATDNFDPGETVATPELKAALDLLRLTADKPEQFQACSIDLSRGYCMVVTDQRHAKITFGLEHIDRQIERLGLVLEHVEEGNREIQTVNLLVQRNVPVTFMPVADPNAPDLEPAAAPSPSLIAKIPGAKKPPVSIKSPTVRKAAADKHNPPPMPVRKASPANAPAPRHHDHG